MTPTLERVLRVFLEDPSARQYGYDLMKAAKVQSGTLYPILARLAAEGIVETQWGERPADGRPARKYYLLTPRGTEIARYELAAAGQTRSLRTKGKLRPLSENA